MKKSTKTQTIQLSNKKIILAGVMGILFGTFGVHDFILRRYFRATIHLALVAFGAFIIFVKPTWNTLLAWFLIFSSCVFGVVESINVWNNVVKSKKSISQLAKDKGWVVLLACLLILAAVGCGIILALYLMSVNIHELHRMCSSFLGGVEGTIMFASFVSQILLLLPTLACACVCLFAKKIKVVTKARSILIIGAISLIIIPYVVVNISSISAVNYYRENPWCSFP